MAVTLGCDPGTKNFAFGVIRGSREKPTVRCTAMLSEPLKVVQGAEFEAQAADLYETFNALLDEFQPSEVLLERYQNRGMVRGAQGEVVTFMNSMLCTLCRARGIPARVIMASTWKTACKRARLDLDKAYAWGKKRKIPPHRIDAALIALYGHLGGFKGVDKKLLWSTVRGARRSP